MAVRIELLEYACHLHGAHHAFAAHVLHVEQRLDFGVGFQLREQLLLANTARPTRINFAEKNLMPPDAAIEESLSSRNFGRLVLDWIEADF